MAVIQISKIQVRRGLQENLPQLASGEMGWSVDEQRLWIGNGSLTEGAPEIGNTEILTSNSDVLNAIESYTFKGQESGYTSVTGPTRNTPVTRSLQNKFDEQISLRDFITAADTLSGDYTTALQRALDQIYPSNYISTVGVRRVLRIPAGTYNISSNILVPPYATIVGDGAEATVLNKTSGTDSVIRLKDSRGNVGVDVNTTSSVAPAEITIKGLTLSTDTDTDVAVLESCHFVDFEEVNFVGGATTVLSSGNNKSCVVVDDSARGATNLSFNRCRFADSTYGVNLQGNVTNFTLDQSQLSNLYQGVTASANVSSPSGVRITASKFQNIAKQAIYSSDNSSIVSAYNYFTVCGNSDGAVMNGTGANSAIISWNTQNNYSVGDLFDRTYSNIIIKPTIETLSSTQGTLTQTTTFGSVADSAGFTETLLDNTSANTSLIISSTSTNIIDYRITRDTANRIGTIKVTQASGSAVYEDDYSETASTGVTLDFTGYGANVTLTYSTTSTGDDATLKYTVRSFI